MYSVSFVFLTQELLKSLTQAQPTCVLIDLSGCIGEMEVSFME